MTSDEKRDRQRAKNRAYYAKNKARENERCKSYHHSKRDERLKVKRDYRDTNSQVLRAKARAARRAKLAADRPRQLEIERFNNRKYRPTRLAWDVANRERIAQRSAEWSNANKGRKRAATARRRAIKIMATPKWANQEAIAAFYVEADRLSKLTGVKHEVDHIVPLNSPLVCGLHCEANLQILTKTQNRKKWNRLAA